MKRWLVLPAVVIAAVQLAVVAPANAGTVQVSKSFQTTGVAQLHGPWGMTTDDLGNVYIADTGAHRIVKFDKDGNGLLAFGIGGSDTSGEQGHLYYPTGIVFANGHLYVVDASSTVNVFSTGGASISQWGVPGTSVGQINVPLDLGTDCAGNIYIANSRNNRIDKFDGNGQFVKAFGIGVLAVPADVAVESYNTGGGCLVASIYVTDEYAGDIKEFAGNGEYIKTIGTNGTGPLQFRGPEQLTFSHDADETPNFTMWVAESGNFRAQKLVSNDGGSTWTYGGEVHSGNGEHFPSTHALALTPEGNLLVAPTNSQIYEYADRAPALKVLRIGGRHQIKRDQDIYFELKYNQVDKSCNVTLKAEVDVPHHNFTVKGHLPGVGNDYTGIHLELSDGQFSHLKKAWHADHKVPLHATATGNCSDSVHVTEHLNLPTI